MPGLASPPTEVRAASARRIRLSALGVLPQGSGASPITACEGCSQLWNRREQHARRWNDSFILLSGGATNYCFWLRWPRRLVVWRCGGAFLLLLLPPRPTTPPPCVVRPALPLLLQQVAGAVRFGGCTRRRRPAPTDTDGHSVHVSAEGCKEEGLTAVRWTLLDAPTPPETVDEAPLEVMDAGGPSGAPVAGAYRPC